jgi:hypothetical protein
LRPKQRKCPTTPASTICGGVAFDPQGEFRGYGFALQLLPSMHWGLPDSVGHYLDLGSAALGVTLFPLGYLWQALTKD